MSEKTNVGGGGEGAALPSRVDVVVVGGGPAGLIAAIRAAQSGARALVLEAMPAPGRKLLLTGGGRCNLTTDRDARAFVEACGPRGRFLHNALSRFDCAAARAFFHSAGLALKREEDGRWFPESDRAADVLATLERVLRSSGAVLRCATPVRSIARADPAGFDVATAAGTVRTRAVVVATGGLSYPGTGSSGDGFRFARAFGHEVTRLLPAEVSLEAGPAWVHELAGVTLPDVVLAFRSGRNRCEVRGPLLFTHYGISGPAVMDASREVCAWLADGSPVQTLADLAPSVGNDDLMARLDDEGRRPGRHPVRAVLRGLVPERVADAVARSAGCDPTAEMASLPLERRRAIPGALKQARIDVTATRGFREAAVTRGGVSTREVDPTTMESRRVPGLFFAGEVLDVDGPRGGFNLQIAWSTGWIAGTRSAAVALESPDADVPADTGGMP